MGKVKTHWVLHSLAQTDHQSSSDMYANVLLNNRFIDPLVMLSQICGVISRTTIRKLFITFTHSLLSNSPFSPTPIEHIYTYRLFFYKNNFKNTSFILKTQI